MLFGLDALDETQRREIDDIDSDSDSDIDIDQPIVDETRRRKIDDDDDIYSGFLKPRSADSCLDDNCFFSKNYPSRKTFHYFTWVDGSNVSTPMTYDEYAAHMKFQEDLLSNPPPGWDDPLRYKENSESACLKCFPYIQEQCPEMADCELVETMGGFSFEGAGAGCCHVNFKAKHKDDRDSSVYFAEFNFTQRKVTCFTKLQTDPSCAGGDGYVRSCDHCHPEKPFPYAEYVYHPDKKVIPWVEGCF